MTSTALWFKFARFVEGNVIPFSSLLLFKLTNCRTVNTSPCNQRCFRRFSHGNHSLSRPPMTARVPQGDKVTAFNALLASNQDNGGGLGPTQASIWGRNGFNNVNENLFHNTLRPQPNHVSLHDRPDSSKAASNFSLASRRRAFCHCLMLTFFSSSSTCFLVSASRVSAASRAAATFSSS